MTCHYTDETCPTCGGRVITNGEDYWCEEGHILTEKRKIPCEVYSRVVGYLRPVQNWNQGKKQEYRDRRVYEQPK